MKGWLEESHIPLHLIHCLSSCVLSHWLLNSYGKNALIYSTGVCGKTHLDLKPKVLKSFVKQGSIQSAKIGGARLLWWNAPGSFVQSVEKAVSLISRTLLFGLERHSFSWWKMHVGYTDQFWLPTRQNTDHPFRKSFQEHSSKDVFSDLELVLSSPGLLCREKNRGEEDISVNTPILSGTYGLLAWGKSVS